VLGIVTCSSGNNSVNSSCFFGKWNSFLYVFFLPCSYYFIEVYLKQCSERRQVCRFPLLIPATIDSLELNAIDILFCMYMCYVAFNNVSGIFLDFKMSNKSCLCILSRVFFFIIIDNKYVSKLYSLRFSVNNLRQSVGFMHDHKMCDLIFSTTSVSNTSHSCTILMTLEFSLHIFEKYSNIKFN